MHPRWSNTFLQPLNQVVQWFGRGVVMPGGNVFIRASVPEQCGGYNTALRFYGDNVDIAFRVGKYGIIHFTQKLMAKSSSQRYKASGFFQVQARYTAPSFKVFFQRYQPAGKHGNVTSVVNVLERVMVPVNTTGRIDDDCFYSSRAAVPARKPFDNVYLR